METSAIASSTSSLSQSAKAGLGLADNFETFLKIFTTQLQNQDPLDPMNSAEFTNQLVQFTGVEQAISTNKNLELLISLFSATSVNNSIGYLGKTITADDARTSLTGGSATWNLHFDATAASAKIEITDASGNVVYQTEDAFAAGDRQFTWDGKTKAGRQLPDGVYTLSIEAATASGAAINARILLKGDVDSVEIENGQPVLKVKGVGLDPSSIISVSEPVSEPI